MELYKINTQIFLIVKYHPTDKRYFEVLDVADNEQVAEDFLEYWKTNGNKESDYGIEETCFS